MKQVMTCLITLLTAVLVGCSSGRPAPTPESAFGPRSAFGRAEALIQPGMTRQQVLMILGAPLRQSQQVAEWNREETETVAEWHSPSVKVGWLFTKTEWRVLVVYFDALDRVRIIRAQAKQN